jgi:hypothetical protein
MLYETTFDPEAMDEAADTAEYLFREHYKSLGKDEQAAVLWVAAWFAQHFMKAGHKRLGRFLVAFSKEALPTK